VRGILASNVAGPPGAIATRPAPKPVPHPPQPSTPFTGARCNFFTSQLHPQLIGDRGGQIRETIKTSPTARIRAGHSCRPPTSRRQAKRRHRAGPGAGPSYAERARGGMAPIPGGMSPAPARAEALPAASEEGWPQAAKAKPFLLACECFRRHRAGDFCRRPAGQKGHQGKKWFTHITRAAPSAGSLADAKTRKNGNPRVWDQAIYSGRPRPPSQDANGRLSQPGPSLPASSPRLPRRWA